MTLALLFIAVASFHWRGLRPGRVFLPVDNVNNNLPWRKGPFVLGNLQNPLIGDPIYQFYPFLVQSVNSLRSGVWPLWTDRLLLGHPLLGDPLAETFYPVFLALGLLFGPARGLTFGYALHALLAAWLTAGWLRAAGRSWTAAVFGGLTYALGGYLVTFFEDTFWVATLAWLPGVLWAYDASVRRRRIGYTALAGFLLGLATLAGQLSFVLVFDLFLLIYAVGYAAAAVAQARRPDLWPLASAGAVLSLGTLAAAVQILPFAEALRQSHRAQAMPYSPVPWRQIMTWIVPDFYGNPSTTGVYWGAFNYAEGVLYAGLVGLLLALLALGCDRRWRTYFLFALGVGLAYFSLGGPGVRMLAALPFLGYVALNRSVFLLPLIVAYLAAITLDSRQVRPALIIAVAAGIAAGVVWAVAANWGEAQSHLDELRRPLVVAAALLAGATGMLLARHRWASMRPRLDWALVVLGFVDLYLAGSGFNPALPIAQLPGPTPAIAYLQAHAGLYRVATRQELGEILFGPNYLSVFGLADLGGYSSLLPARVLNLVRAGDPASQGYNANTIWLGQPSLRLLDILQAGHLVSRLPLTDLGLRSEQIAGECAAATAELTQAHPLAGAFTVQSTAINRLDLSFRVDSPPRTGQFEIRLWQGGGRERLVLESRADVAQVADRASMTFFFAPEKNAPGQTYVWEVSTAAPVTGLRLCARADGTAALGVYGADWQVVYAGEVAIAERLAPLPRSYVVYAAETLADERLALARVLDDAFDMRNSAVTDQPVGLPAQSERLASPAEIVEYSAQRVVISATARADGLLLLGDYDYPGWQVTVDGHGVPSVGANYIWRGVPLPAGTHRVIFELRPASLRAGLWLSGLAAAMLLGISAWEWRQRRRV